MEKTYHSRVGTPANGSIWVGERSVSAAAAYIAGRARRLKKNYIFIILWTMTFGISAIVYTKSFYPDFIATTQILLRPQFIVNDGPENLRHFYQLMLDGDQCETELQVLSSNDLLFQVFANLKLADASELRQGADGFWAFLNSRVNQLGRQSTENIKIIEAFNAFRGRVRARRLGFSYVIEISYRAHSAEQATRIVNAIASTYAVYRLRGVLAHEQRRGAYLASRLTSLSNQITAAEAGSLAGIIPEDGMPDSDVRLLGPAIHPLGIAYPKTVPLMLMMSGLGLVTGLLIVLILRGEPKRDTDRTRATVTIQRA